MGNLPKFRPRNLKLFWLKIGTHGMLEMLIPDPDLYFWNSNSKIDFWANLGQKSQSCSFSLKIGTHGILRILILILTLTFWISNPKSVFGQIWAEKTKLSILSSNWHTFYLGGADSVFGLRFLKFWPPNFFGGKFGLKSQNCPFCLKMAHTVSWRSWFWIQS